MKQLEVMPNLLPSVATWQTHQLPLNPACPVSGNPRAGSTLEIRYRPQKWHLEVYSLRSFVDQFSGGLRCPHIAPGEYLVRDQEHMVQYVVQSCSNAVGVPVVAIARLVLSDGAGESGMVLRCRATPQTDSAKLSRYAK